MSNTHNPYMSIIVPVYNAGDYFVACIDSLLSQSVDKEAIEILLIDDGSNDGSEVLCDQIAKKYPNLFKVYHQAPSGYASAPRNKGIDLARGKYIFFHDADDILRPEACERMISHSKNWDSDVIVFKEARVWSDGSYQVVPKYADWGGVIPQGDRFAECFLSDLDPRRLFKRSLITENGLRFKPFINEDLLFSLEALSRADIVSFAADYTYVLYVQRNDGNINSLPNVGPKSFDSRLDSIRCLFDSLEKSNRTNEAFPFVYKKIFEHPVYKTMTTAMSSGEWENLESKLRDLRELIIPYWNGTRADVLLTTERIVIELLVSERYSDIPLARELAITKGTGKAKKNTGFDTAKPVELLIKNTNLSERSVERLLLRQLDNTAVYVAVKEEKEGYIIYGCCVSPLAIAGLTSVAIRTNEDKCYTCEILNVTERIESLSKLVVFWRCNEVFSKKPETTLEVMMLVSEDYVCNNKMNIKSIPSIRISSGVDLKSRTDAIERAVEIVSLSNNSQKFKDLTFGIILNSSLYPAITTTIDKGLWGRKEVEKDTVRLQAIASRIYNQESKMVVNLTEKAVIEALINRKISQIPNIRLETKEAAKKMKEKKTEKEEIKRKRDSAKFWSTLRNFLKK